MRELLSPKQVARAIGVSESSLKRWCDRGIIPTERTAGGHRRLPRDGVVRFIREGGYQVADPGVLGLPLSAGKTRLAVDVAKDRFREAATEGNETTCRQLIFDVYLAGHPISVICDQVIASAFHEIGDHWECGDLEVFQERRACEIAVRMIHAAGMVELAPRIRFSHGFVSAARAALIAGAPILCDAHMVSEGVTRVRLPADNIVLCTLRDPRVPGLAAALETTRSAAALELWRSHLAGALVAIGNAPTALFHLCFLQ